MAVNEVFVGDIGTELRFNVGVANTEINTATIKVVKPDKSTVEWTAELGPGEEEISYIVKDGDFDLSGTYKFQPYVELSSWRGHGTISQLSVKNTL
jgi:hypothetical protein